MSRGFPRIQVTARVVNTSRRGDQSDRQQPRNEDPLLSEADKAARGNRLSSPASSDEAPEAKMNRLMSSDIYAKPDLSKKVRYSRKEQEDRAEWEQREVDIYEIFWYTATLALRVLCLLMLAGIIILSICYALNKSQLQDQLQGTKTNLTQLQSSYDKLSKNHSQLQEEVKKLKEKIEEKCPDRWTRFGSSCYFKSHERKTWSDSRRDCQDKGADLVMINSKEEQEFINELNMRGESWIGLRATYKQTSGGYKWEWVDGSALTET
ncbi:CD209 antigen-like protein E [Oreochromis aureus]|uniref:CD209 antigen-like protein E n=1 Tax=Oreochromis aureus TaxID=47969 RepID=UPI001953B624|nr:CD209 antigen-like protein E [Oreochromis aureus]